MKKDKVICHCYNIKVAKIIKAVEKGTTDWKDLKKELKIATDCKKSIPKFLFISKTCCHILCYTIL